MDPLTPEMIDAALNGSTTAASAPAADASTMFGRMAAKVPTLLRGARAGMGALRAGGALAAKYLPVAGTALVAGGEGLNTLDVANDPATSKIDVATRGAEGVGRLGSMGAGAGLGFAAGGPIGAAVGGTLGYFAPNAVYAARDWMRGGPTAPAALTAPPAAAPAPAPAPAVAPAAASAAPAPVAAPVAPFTAVDSALVPHEGMGAFLNNRTGDVTSVGSPVGPGAVPNAGYRPRTAAGSFFQAGAGLKILGNAQARDMAKSKLWLDYLMKQPGMTKDAAEATLAQQRVQAAERARLAGASDRDVAAITTGRSTGAGDTVVIPSMLPDGPVQFANKSKNTVTSVIPTRAKPDLTMAQAVALQKKNGTYRTDAQVRSDAAKFGYKITD